MLNEKLMAEVAENAVNNEFNPDARVDIFSAYVKAQEKRNSDVLTEAISKGILKKDSDGNLSIPEKKAWIEEESYNPTPHHITVHSDMIKVTRAECDGHRYEVYTPSAWGMQNYICIIETTNRECSKEYSGHYKSTEARSVYMISIEDAIDVLRRKVDKEDLTKEVVDVLRVIIKRSWKKITF